MSAAIGRPSLNGRDARFDSGKPYGFPEKRRDDKPPPLICKQLFANFPSSEKRKFEYLEKAIHILEPNLAKPAALLLDGCEYVLLLVGSIVVRPHSKSLSSVRFKVLRHGRTSLWLAGFGFQAAGAADEQVLSAAIGVACCTIRIFAAVWRHTHPVVLFSPSFKAVRFRPPVPVPPGGVSSSV